MAEAEAAQESADSMYNNAKDISSSSQRLDAFIEGYNVYPDDERFTIGINESATSLLRWAENQGYNTAVNRAEMVLDAPKVNDSIRDRALVLLSTNASGLSSSSQRLEAHIDFYNEYGSAILAEGINDSANSLLGWAEGQDANTMIDRAEKVLASPALDSVTQKRAQILKENPAAVDYYNQTKSIHASSQRLEAYIHGYNTYTDQSMFTSGIIESANSLLDWAQKQGYDTAVNRAELVLSSPALDTATRNRALDLLSERASGLSASSQRLEAHIEFYNKYNNSRFSDGINESANSLLGWSERQGYNTAVNRAEIVLDAPAVDNATKNRALDLLSNKASGLSASSQRLEAHIEFYNKYENSRFSDGINESAHSLLGWSERQGYDTAVNRAEIVLDAPRLNSSTRNRALDLLYDKTANLSTSSQRLEAYIKFQKKYNNSRFITGINESATGLLKWATGEHQNRNFEVAIGRYELIIDAPHLDSSIRQDTRIKLIQAQTGNLPGERTIIAKTKYELTFSQAIQTQMTRSPQTTTPRGYVHGDYIEDNKVTASSLNVRSAPSTSSRTITSLSQGQTVNIIGQSGQWLDVTYSKSGLFHNASEAAVAEYLNPDGNDIFQHLVLSSSVGVSASQLNNLLSGKGILSGRGQAFVDAGQEHSINEIYLISHAILETGHGTSALATGIDVGRDDSGQLVLVTSNNKDNLTSIRTTYNVFGIGAADSAPNRLGAIYAYNAGWFSPESAIKGGAIFITSSYFNRGQDTLYKMKWNHAYPTSTGFYAQYATDIGWAVKQVSNIKNMYRELSNPFLYFNIVEYR